jgi:hypothetical protein
MKRWVVPALRKRRMRKRRRKKKRRKMQKGP